VTPFGEGFVEENKKNPKTKNPRRKTNMIPQPGGNQEEAGSRWRPRQKKCEFAKDRRNQSPRKMLALLRRRGHVCSLSKSLFASLSVGESLSSEV